MSSNAKAEELCPWRIEAVLAFPRKLKLQASPESGDPVPVRESRIPTQAVVTGGVAVQVQPYDGAGWGDEWIDTEAASLILWTIAKSDSDAFEKVIQLLELVVNDMSFQLQEPLPIKQLEVLRVPVNAEVGQISDASLFPYPHGYSLYKETRNTVWGSSVRTDQFPALRPQYAALPKRVQHALDWYLKGLQAHADADRFIAFWIALEIMRSESGIKVTEPTLLQCRHEVLKCPQCKEPTDQYRQAASTKKFLASFGIPEDVYKRLWKMRQIVHGAGSFNESLLNELGELVQIAQGVAMIGLRGSLGITSPSPTPLGIAPTATRGISLLMTRALGARDLRGMPDHAGMQIEVATQTGEELYRTLSMLGNALRVAGDLVGAEELFRRLMEAPHPDAVAVGKVNLGIVLSLGGATDESVTLLESVISDGGQRAAGAADSLGIHYIGQLDFERARLILEPFAGAGEIEQATKYAEFVGDKASDAGEREQARVAYELACLTSDTTRKKKIQGKLQALPSVAEPRS